MIQPAKFTYYPLGKAFEKQIKQLRINKGNKLKIQSQIQVLKSFEQLLAIKGAVSKNPLNEEAKNEKEKI